MEVSLILILLPGLVAFGISKIFSGIKARPINEIIIDLVLQTIFVFIIYYVFTFVSFFDSPKFSDIVMASLKIKATTDNEIIKSQLVIIEKALLVLIILAILIGFCSALFKELKLIQKLGRRFWLFQSDADDTAWKTTFASGSSDCWVHIDTKGGKRYIGLSHSVSWEQKDGGIGLSNVHLYNEDCVEIVAEYIYVPFEELDGPILFVKGSQK